MMKKIILIAITILLVSCKHGKQAELQQKTDIDTAAIKLRLKAHRGASGDSIKLAHNKVVESSPEYQRILPEVMKEVYTKYVEYKIIMLENHSKKWTDEDSCWADETKEKIILARQLMSENKVEEAFEVVREFGACHVIWPLQQSILKEKYNIIWYTPIECYPNIIFD